jgi:P27 family predicted phage terminase small subunit
VFQKSIWKGLTRVMEEMGTLTKADGWTMERFCVNFVRWRKCQAHIEKHGESYAVKMYPKDTHGRLDESRAGKVIGAKMFPESKMAIQLDGVLSQLEGKLGLSPADRARIEIPQKKETGSKKERFIKVG